MKRKSRFKSFILFLFLVGLLLFVLFLLGAYVFDVKARTVVVHNNTVLTDQQVMDAAFPNHNFPNFFLVNSNQIERKLKENPIVKSVTLKRKLFFEVHLYVKENKPLFFREDINKITLNSGLSLNNNDDYNFEVPSLINYVPDTKYKILIEKMDSIDYSIIKKMSDIKYDPNKYDEDRFLIFMNDSNKVYINLPKFKNLNKYDSMVEKFEGKRGTLYLDSGNYFKVNK